VKARQYFENAIALDAQNAEAMNDLFDYYLNAPGFLGGGVEKAEGIARRIEHQRPAEYQHELAQLADHKKQSGEALAHLHRAMELAPNEPGRVVDLARYLAKLGRMEESDSYFAEAAKRWPNHPAVAFEQAKTDIDHHREAERSKELLQQYLKAQVTPDDPSKQSAEKLLRQVASR
jgi:tetratricopeptide (TPR) repeat protein